MKSHIVVQPYPRDHGFNKLDLHYFKDAFDQVSTYLTNRFLKKKRFSLFYSLVKMKPILWFNAELFICTRPKGVSTQVLAWLSGQIVSEKFLKIFFDIFLYKEDYLKEVTKFQ